MPNVSESLHNGDTERTSTEPPLKRSRRASPKDITRSHHEHRSTAKGKEREMTPPALPVACASASLWLLHSRWQILPAPSFKCPDYHKPSLSFSTTVRLWRAGSVPKIILRHPANNCVFLYLPAYDPLPAPSLQFGLHHETVVTACKILACNRLDTFLYSATTTPSGSILVQIQFSPLTRIITI
jgi:hypothetical protein